MTFTAMRPDVGLSRGRWLSLLSVAKTSSLISALRSESYRTSVRACVNWSVAMTTSSCHC